MSESADIHAVNQKQAQAAQRQQFDAAAQAVLAAELVPMTGQSIDLLMIRAHHDNLVRFAPELMDERFAQQVSALIAKCNNLLDAPVKEMFGIDN